MMKRTLTTALLSGALALGPVVGCESLPGSEEEQGAVIGGLGGAAAGAAVAGEDNRLTGALIGGVLGAGGGYLLGANWDKVTGNEEEAREEARQAAQEAQEDPATVADVEDSRTADLNDDGFVTLDEVVALERAGLSDEEIVDRLEATDQYFQLTEQQEQYLADRGISRRVITAMEQLQPEPEAQLAGQRDEVISRDEDPVLNRDNDRDVDWDLND